MNKYTIPLLLLSFLLFNSTCRKKNATVMPLHRIAQLSDTITPLKFIFFDKKTNKQLDSILNKDIISYETDQAIGHFNVHRMMLKETKKRQLQKSIFIDSLVLNCYLKGNLFFSAKHFNMYLSNFQDKKNIRFFFNIGCKKTPNGAFMAEDGLNPNVGEIKIGTLNTSNEKECLGISFLYQDYPYRQRREDTLDWELKKLQSPQYLNLLKDLKLLKKYNF